MTEKEKLWEELSKHCKAKRGLPFQKVWNDGGGSLLWDVISDFINEKNQRLKNELETLEEICVNDITSAYKRENILIEENEKLKNEKL